MGLDGRGCPETRVRERATDRPFTATRPGEGAGKEKNQNGEREKGIRGECCHEAT